LAPPQNAPDLQPCVIRDARQFMVAPPPALADYVFENVAHRRSTS
jgi:hypothetical protein